MNIGILTSGGDCPGLNAVIRSVVLTAKKNNPENKVYGFLDGFEGLYTPGKQKELQIVDVENIERVGGTILGTTNRGDFGEIGSLKAPSPQAMETINKIKETKERLNLTGLVVTGGDGSLRIAYWVGQQTGMNIIGVPKTIDNDLANTEITLGFNTAVQTATDAIAKIRDTARSHHRVMIVEVMGRDAGWIALESGIAGGADCILIPEIPYDLNSVTRFIKEQSVNEMKSIVIVIAEGAREKSKDINQKGSGEAIAQDIQKQTGIETRLTILGYIQRGGEPSCLDKVLGARLGQKSTELLLNDEKNLYVSVKNNGLINLPLSMASAETRFVPKDHEIVHSAKSMGIYFGD
jgi:6-phosphofructokinase 1